MRSHATSMRVVVLLALAGTLAVAAVAAAGGVAGWRRLSLATPHQVSEVAE